MAKSCSKCHSTMPESAIFCPQCGAKADAERKTCPSCHTENDAKAKFCVSCGGTFATAKNLSEKKQKSKTASKVAASEGNALSPAYAWSIMGIALLALAIVGAFYYVNFVEPLQGKGTVAQSNVHDHSSQDHSNEGTASTVTDADVQAVANRLREAPNDPVLNTQMGNLLFDQGKFGDAIPYYQKSLEERPNDPDVIVDLGVCYFNLQDYPKARENFELANRLDPNHINALYNLGVVSVQQGDMNQLIAYWSKLQQIAPGSPQAQRAQEILNQIHQGVQEFTPPNDGKSE